MTLRQLEVVYAIMKWGSITSAAQALHVSQPAISTVLKHAEQQLSVTLFERNGGRLIPTKEALAVLPELEELFGRVDTITRTMASLKESSIGKLIIATNPTLSTSLVTQAVTALMKDCPQLQVRIDTVITPVAVTRVACQEADVGVIYSPAKDTAVHTEELMQSHIVAAVPVTHRLATEKLVSIDELQNETVISTGLNTPLGRSVADACRSASLSSPRIGIETNSSLTAAFLANNGAGIALIDHMVALTGMFNNVVFVPLAPTVPIPIRLAFCRGRVRSAPCERFVSLLTTLKPTIKPRMT